MLIKVTADHIAKGRRWKIRHCPIALAIIDAGFKNIRVCVGRVKIDESEIPLPSLARVFMRDFDGNRPVKPIEFEIKIQGE